MPAATNAPMATAERALIMTVPCHRPLRPFIDVDWYPASVSGSLRRCGKRFRPAGVLFRPRPGDETLSARVAMWAAGALPPSQKPRSTMRSPCGETFDSHDPPGSYIHRGHIYAAQAADGISRR